MRTIGMLACCATAASSCSGVSSWRVTRISPSAARAAPAAPAPPRRSAAAWPSGARRARRRCARRAERRHTPLARDEEPFDAAFLVDRRGRNSPCPVSTWPMVCPVSSPPAVSDTGRRRGRWSSTRARGRRTARRCRRTRARPRVAAPQRLAELVEAQRHRRPRRRHLHLDQALVGDEEDQPALHALVVQAEDLACPAGLLLDHLRVGGERRRRPGEDRIARLAVGVVRILHGAAPCPAARANSGSASRSAATSATGSAGRTGSDSRFETSRIGGAATLRATRPLEGTLGRPGLRPCPEMSGPSATHSVGEGARVMAAPARPPPTMNKAFTREAERDEEDDDAADGGAPALPPGTRNYITPQGYPGGCAELLDLLDVERPKVVEVVSWGGEERRPLGERRLPVRQEAAARDRPADPLPDQGGSIIAEVAGSLGPPRQRPDLLRRDASPTRQDGSEHTITIKGIDEADSLAGEVSWVSPIARADQGARRRRGAARHARRTGARRGARRELPAPPGTAPAEVAAFRVHGPVRLFEGIIRSPLGQPKRA